MNYIIVIFPFVLSIAFAKALKPLPIFDRFNDNGLKFEVNDDFLMRRV